MTHAHNLKRTRCIEIFLAQESRVDSESKLLQVRPNLVLNGARVGVAF
jgi:hypothetical protein